MTLTEALQPFIRPRTTRAYQVAGPEKLRDVNGSVVVVTRDRVVHDDLDAEDRLLRALLSPAAGEVMPS